jgi:hypothetical protein
MNFPYWLNRRDADIDKVIICFPRPPIICCFEYGQAIDGEIKKKCVDL